MGGLTNALDHVLPSAAFQLARRFADGATMWCVAPQWPEHARHLAVEFVHPVVVGARALPAVSVPGPDPVGALRAAVRAGDIVAVVSSAADPVALELVRRGPAWGATTLWLATGNGVMDSSADLTVRVDDADGTAPFDGRLVLHYHLLWELTHVCFEHPGLLERRDETDEVVCVTCRDDGRLAEVVRVSVDGHDVEVRTASGHEHADGTLVTPLVPDDLVLVHAGSVIARVGAS
ncbi:MAG TPA: hypothetical protein VIY72_03195 [Acidimicrobiales bacterium]